MSNNDQINWSALVRGVIDAPRLFRRAVPYCPTALSGVFALIDGPIDDQFTPEGARSRALSEVARACATALQVPHAPNLRWRPSVAIEMIAPNSLIIASSARAAVDALERLGDRVSIVWFETCSSEYTHNRSAIRAWRALRDKNFVSGFACADWATEMGVTPIDRPCVSVDGKATTAPRPDCDVVIFCDKEYAGGPFETYEKLRQRGLRCEIRTLPLSWQDGAELARRARACLCWGGEDARWLADAISGMRVAAREFGYATLTEAVDWAGRMALRPYELASVRSKQFADVSARNPQACASVLVRDYLRVKKLQA